MRGEKRIVRPAERDPGNARLRLQLRKEDEFALVGFARLKHILQKQGADRGVRGSSLSGDGVELLCDRRDDLLVDGGGKRLAVRLGRPHHSSWTPTAVTMIEASTRPEIASRTPIRILSNLPAAIDMAAYGRPIVYFA